MAETLSLQSFRECIREAARHWFDLARRKHATETLYAFALYTDDDAMGICHATNSLEALAKKIATRREPPSPNQIAHYRWCTSEWEYEDGRSGYPALDQFDVARLRQEEAKKDNDFYFPFKVFRAMINALGDLDREGFFGVGEQRAAVTILVSVTDSTSATAVETVSVNRLNPAVVVKRFLDDLAVRSMLAD